MDTMQPIFDSVVDQITEEQGIRLYNQMARKFSWTGTLFTIDEVRETIERHYEADEEEPLTELEMERAVDEILDSWEWSTGMETRMIDAGYDQLDTAVIEWRHLKEVNDGKA